MIATFEVERTSFLESKKHTEELSRKQTQQNYGLEKLIEDEVRLRLQKHLQQMTEEEENSSDLDAQALEAFVAMRNEMQIDYNRINE